MPEYHQDEFTDYVAYRLKALEQIVAAILKEDFGLPPGRVDEWTEAVASWPDNPNAKSQIRESSETLAVNVRHAQRNRS